MFKRPFKLGTTCLAIFLIAYGAIPVLRLGNETIYALLHILAIAAGVLIWLDR